MILNFYKQLQALNPTSISGQIYSLQMTLTADELIFHKICANDDIEAILGKFGPLEVPHTAK